ncbi:probable cytochrome P450 28d1 [Ochlerotatus camptorhynchus]|uniref:probable cytochrome P450 28d1 n=1 Tax=Ochlerotatus camptorhynchus TaxID=644619 RepID=UPI0031D42D83
MLVTVGLLLSAIVALYFYLTWNFDYWKKRNVPGPDPLPLVGNFPAFFRRNRPVMEEKYQIYRDYGSKYNFVGIFTNRSPQIFITSPGLARDILVKYFKNFHDNEIGLITNKELDPLFGRNPFVLNGAAWKAKRAEMTPAFTASRIKALYFNVEDVCATMTKYIKERAGSSIEMKELGDRFTTDVVSSCIFGADAQSFIHDDAEIREMGSKLMDSSFLFVLKMSVMTVLPSVAKLFNISLVSRPREMFFIKLMSEAIRHREASSEKRLDYLDYLSTLKRQKHISELDMAANGVTFFLDGNETSSATLTLTLYEVAKQPDIQKRLREELLKASNEDGTIACDALSELPYLEQVFSESLRLWPPVTFMSKVCTDRIELELTANRRVPIERGTCAIISNWSLHRDPTYYEDPLTFNPDRFAPEKGGIYPYREKGCYMPFGDGPRQCLGMRFGRMQVKRGIFEIIRNFEISVDSQTRNPLRIVSSPAISLGLSGVWLNFKPIGNKLY